MNLCTGCIAARGGGEGYYNSLPTHPNREEIAASSKQSREIILVVRKKRNVRALAVSRKDFWGGFKVDASPLQYKIMWGYATIGLLQN